MFTTHPHPHPHSLHTSAQQQRIPSNPSQLAHLNPSDGRMGFGQFPCTPPQPHHRNHSSSSPPSSTKTSSLSFAPSSPSTGPPDLFPTFGDFLPRDVGARLGGKKGAGRSAGGQRTMGLGLSFGGAVDEGKGARVRSDTSPLDGWHSTFASMNHPTSSREGSGDTFIFCPSTSFPSRSTTKSDIPPFPQGTPRSLRSPSPRFNNDQQHYPTTSTPITPPSTPHHPRRNLRPLHPTHSLPPTPPSSNIPLATYPLSPGDTDRIAHLHNGRIPSMEQLAPRVEEAHSHGYQHAIINTGNQGPMVVQQGDWSCGVCAFVNWRRRKICLRCFPYANDIGNLLTINSQRAASLAGGHAPPLATQQHHEQHTYPAPFQHVPLPLPLPLPPSALAPPFFPAQQEGGPFYRHL